MSTEEEILRAVKRTLTEIARDTATPPGMKHPLSEATINGVRDSLVMISQREQALAAADGRSFDLRPHYKDEAPPAVAETVVSLDELRRK
ncbi:MAG: segregation and condensation protein A [Gammaproteobacteria bacterium]|nr:segregation and condensation protein A [Gammaproteobacteria bacterium]